MGDGLQRKRKSSTAGEVEATQCKRIRKQTNGTSRLRSRGPSLPPYDPHADPGEELDPTTVTMASLCDDIGQGRVSSKAAEILSNHAAWKARNREKRTRMRTLMELRKYGREHEAEQDQSQGTADPKESACTETQEAVAPPTSSNVMCEKDSENGFDYTQGLASSKFNVQVRIGPNGETIIDEESLVVDRGEIEETQDYTHVVESDTTKFVNSATYSKRFRGSRWSAEETERFYDALSQYGENYELIAYVLPGRDRKSCKNKFKVEDKRNPARINYCLNNRIPVDMQTLSRMTGKDFSGPVPEIRAPTPRLTEGMERTEELAVDAELERGEEERSRNLTEHREEMIIIVGNTEQFHS
ncbi:hypothetical protein AMATHDRAFT_134961 [Amanita thiersii Skay4041]|uniref:Uncharacterized protein n=1 Tax=Amanita thiersii Skay4041 TaxID=703135 RepID=A0A2A9NXC6_9AGAR|nr:hypothetical protein AMATHDRAFT_134961 [Amanita thiersii Skay4041]